MIYRVGLYLIFVLIAAPFEIIQDFWAGVAGADPQLKLRPIAEGLVYIYAFILVIETWFRLQQEDFACRVNPKLKAVQAVCIILIFAFVFDYMGVARVRLLKGQSVADSINRQLAMAATALLCSIISYVLVERTKSLHARRR